MKNRNIYMILLLAALPFLSGCPSSKTVMTKVNRDGSCVRTIGNFDPRDFEGIDSVKHNLPIPVDNLWNLEPVTDTIAVLSKEFKTVSELNALFGADESELHIYNRRVELTKNFRWFHTVIQYRETYEGLLTEIPLTQYMSESEAELFKYDGPKDHPILDKLNSKSRELLMDNIEERFEFWLQDNIFSLAFHDIIEIADSMQIIEKQEINLVELKDTVIQHIYDASKQFITFDFGDSMDMMDLALLMGEELELDTIVQLKLIRKVEQADLDKKYEEEILGGFGSDYENILMMPGLLTDTNAEVLHGDTLLWDVQVIKYIDSDYVMFAESKVTNHWAYFLSGFIILIAVMIPFLGKLRKQKG